MDQGAGLGDPNVQGQGTHVVRKRLARRKPKVWHVPGYVYNLPS